MERNQAFLLGLLHDVGKVALLACLSKEIKSASEVNSALIGKLFLKAHEAAGLDLAVDWRLSEELVSVAGRHHNFRENEKFPRSAALVTLAHKMDLFLSLNADEEFRQLASGDEFEFLGLADANGILTSVEALFDQTAPREAQAAA